MLDSLFQGEIGENKQLFESILSCKAKVATNEELEVKGKEIFKDSTKLKIG